MQAFTDIKSFFIAEKENEYLGYSQNHSLTLKGSQDLYPVQPTLKEEAVQYFTYQQTPSPHWSECGMFHAFQHYLFR